MDWMLLPLRRYAEFTGRSRRREYWMYTLLVVLAAIGLSIMDGVLGLMVETVGILSTLFALSMALGLLTEHVQVFRLLRVQPFRAVATWAMFSAAVWLAALAFGAIAG